MVEENAVGDYFFKIQSLDWTALVFFILCVVGYRTFLALMLKSRPGRLYLGKLQAYRNAWVNTHSGDQNSIVVVQTLRNNIMTASFLASTAVILIMGAVNLLGSIDTLSTTMAVFQHTPARNPLINLIKVLLIIVTLCYTFFNFSNHIRELNYMSYILNIPKAQLDEIEGGDSASLISGVFLSSGIHFSMGMRGYYFLIPLFMWLFSPVFMILATIFLLIILMRRDLAG